MTSELDVLRIVSERLDAARVSYMLTGSYALAYYTTLRMTRDLDLVVSLVEEDVAAIVGVFGRSLLDDNVDRKYLEQWAGRLGVAELMRIIDDE